jgi:hypothetical protein
MTEKERKRENKTAENNIFITCSKFTAFRKACVRREKARLQTKQVSEKK